MKHLQVFSQSILLATGDRKTCFAWIIGSKSRFFERDKIGIAQAIEWPSAATIGTGVFRANWRGAGVQKVQRHNAV